ncbi:MAG: hypothetical protein NC218_09085 [Acetobacter sp.]|nr:hypothetical protein [Acetobacter sp.]
MRKQNSYKFVWHKNEKYGEPITRETWIFTAGGRQAAVNIFMQACGNLKKNTIERAEEYTTKGMEFFTPEVVKQNGRYVAV